MFYETIDKDVLPMHDSWIWLLAHSKFACVPTYMIYYCEELQQESSWLTQIYTQAVWMLMFISKQIIKKNRTK